MIMATKRADEDCLRHLTVMSMPAVWPVWPFLPMVRRKPDHEEEYGILYDQVSRQDDPAHRSTVYFTNLFMLPEEEADFLKLPKEVYRSPEEVYAADWRVD